VSYKVVHTEPVPPAKLNPSVPPGLEKIILKCIAKSPAARYQTGEELARELAGLRGGKNSASLEKTAMRVPLPVETDATIDFHAASQSASVAAPRRVVEAPPAAKKGNWFVPALVLVAALLAGGWYILRGRHSSEAKALSSPTATTAPATVAPPISNVAAPLAAPPVSTPAKPVTATPKKSVGGSETETPAKISKPAAVVSEEPPALAIDPKSLDPNANAKLKIDPPHAPDSVEFLVEMNGKKFYQWNGSGDRSEYKNLLVPPGVNEFRVIGRSNGTQVTSNIVSAEFKAKKHKTLKIELRNQPKPSHDAPTPPLSPESQLFVTLK
jgi:serine/threonine-protein kinase